MGIVMDSYLPHIELNRELTRQTSQQQAPPYHFMLQRKHPFLTIEKTHVSMLQTLDQWTFQQAMIKI